MPFAYVEPQTFVILPDGTHVCYSYRRGQESDCLQYHYQIWDGEWYEFDVRNLGIQERTIDLAQAQMLFRGGDAREDHRAAILEWARMAEQEGVDFLGYLEIQGIELEAGEG